MKTSIVIPAYKPLELLKECIHCIFKNTTMDDVEILVVCNGSEPETADYLVHSNFSFIWHDEPIGFTKAANEGFKCILGKVVIIMNTDAHIMDFLPKDIWLNKLLAPLEHPGVGIVGLGGMWTKYGMYVPFHCAAIKTELFDEIGYLDERFNPGYCEDADFCYRARKAGYDTVIVDVIKQHPTNPSWSSTNFPIFHAGEQSFVDKAKRLEYINKGLALLDEKWGNK